jgi:hypothetical protein
VSLAKRGASIIAALVVAIAALVVVTSPAQAALPYCNNVAAWRTGSSSYPAVYFESYRSGGGTATNQCDMYTNTWGTAGERSAIKMLQRDINICYIYRGKISASPLTVDGEYGSLTKAAVKKVQIHLGGLTQDGWAGPATRGKMEHVSFEYPDEGCFKLGTGSGRLSGYDTVTWPYPD